MTEVTSRFRIKTLLKDGRPGYHLSTVSFSRFVDNTNLCVVTHLGQYIIKIAELRNSEQLIIGYKKPHAPVSCNTIARWLKNVLQQSGIDTSVYSAHSTRTASTSAAAAMGCPIDDILSNANIFYRLYDKQTDEMCNQLDVKLLETITKKIC